MKKEKANRIMTSIYVNPDTYKELMNIRWEIKMSFNAIAREALEKWLELYKNR